VEEENTEAEARDDEEVADLISGLLDEEDADEEEDRRDQEGDWEDEEEERETQVRNGNKEERRGAAPRGRSRTVLMM
jgi:hypothetical protein